MIQSKKLLMQNFVSNVTLTVSTNPVSATCTLTYNGQSYETKSAIVPKGTTVSYSIYHATYGTITGTITMDDNKTLICNGTYSTISTDVSWSQPTLSSNGTWGSSNFAVKADSEYSSSRATWKAFNGNGTTDWWSANTKNTYPINIYMYISTAVKITKLLIYNSNNSSQHNVTFFSAGTLDYSSNGSSWSSACSWTNSISATAASWTISNSSNIYAKYWRLHATAGTAYGTTNQGLSEIYITAYKQTTSYNYYWNKTIS